MLLVTGGAGFIGSNFVHEWLGSRDESVLVVDKLSYAGNLRNLDAVREDPRLTLAVTDICDRAAMDALLERHRPRAIVHFAAETHVDRSIRGPAEFVRNNIVGTFELLEATRAYWDRCDPGLRAGFRFVHVSTDEVFGDLGMDRPACDESAAYAPNNPYAASKAASDHLVRAYHRTYGMPMIATHSTNNYGPHQHPEKLIPLMLHNALANEPLPIYGDGSQVRDWIYVRDHCRGLLRVLDAGVVGETYHISANARRRNIDVVVELCRILDELRPRNDGSHARAIRHVEDRPGHDHRYALDAHKMRRELGWSAQESFVSGLQHTVRWYLAHMDWFDRIDWTHTK